MWAIASAVIAFVVGLTVTAESTNSTKVKIACYEAAKANHNIKCEK